MGKLTFSSRVNVETLLLAAALASCRVRLIFRAGLAGGESSVFGVELVLEALGVVSMIGVSSLIKRFGLCSVRLSPKRKKGLTDQVL
jgi:hypothetical protein